MKEYYTYAYLREDGTPYYIGKGKGRRINAPHDSVGLPPKDRRIYLKQNLTEQQALNHEIYMIDVFGRKDIGTGMLRNQTPGGDNPPRNKMAGWNKGMKMNFGPERGEKISKALKGKKKSAEHCKNLSNACMGRIPWNKGKSRFKNEEERLTYKREYSRLFLAEKRKNKS